MDNLVFTLRLNPTNCKERSLVITHKTFRTYRNNKCEKLVYCNKNTLIKMSNKYHKRQEQLFNFVLRECI